MIMAGNSAQNSEQERERKTETGESVGEKETETGHRGREVNGRTETANEGNS